MSEEIATIEPEKRVHPNWKGAVTNEEVRKRREALELNKVSPEPDKEAKKEVSIEEVKKLRRKERIPFGGARLKLSAPSKEGKVRRWVNDVGGRCQLAENGGYEFVTDDGLKIGDTNVGSGNQSLDSHVSRIVGTQANGDPMVAFLMEIDEEIYQEDQDEKQRKLDLVDDQIKHGNIEGIVGRNGRYIPKEGITYKP